MPRNIPVGNDSLLITFDEDYCIRDIYFPCVGKENHTVGHRFRTGLWVDGQFSWIDRSWNLNLEYAGESIMSHVTAVNERLGVTLHCNDLVDYRENIYIKKILIRNLADRKREFRLFFQHDFHISESPTGDTAYYDPDERAVIHYKGNRYFLTSGMRNSAHGIDQFATGVKEFRGMEGTWRDAEDGVLGGNPIAQGSVDSTIGFTVTVEASGLQTIYYWITAGQNYSEVSTLNKMVVGHGVEHLIARTDSYWSAWIDKEGFDLSVLPAGVANLFRNSLLIMRTNVDSTGAIMAANDSDIQHFARDTYSYMWPRDGALTAYAFDLAGYIGISRRFFDFCLDIIGKGKESVGYFLHKYNPDGSLGSSWHPWISDSDKKLPIQEDGTGLVLWALWHHFHKYRDIEFIVRLYEQLVTRCGDFLTSYRDGETGLPLPSYDLWEEKWGVHTFTVSAVYAGIRAAENFTRFFSDFRRAKMYARAADEIRTAMDTYLYSREHGRFLKSIVPRDDGSFDIDLTVDSSMYAPFYFGVFEPDDERVVNTMHAIREKLWVKTEVGGIARYEYDYYHRVSDNVRDVPGNPWFICTLWLAQWHIARAKTADDLKEVIPILEWVVSRALPSGVLAEQVHPYTNKPLSVSPLTWSHAAFVTTVLEYLNKLETIHVCPMCGAPLHSHRRDMHHG